MSKKKKQTKKVEPKKAEPVIKAGEREAATLKAFAALAFGRDDIEIEDVGNVFDGPVYHAEANPKWMNCPGMSFVEELTYKDTGTWKPCEHVISLRKAARIVEQGDRGMATLFQEIYTVIHDIAFFSTGKEISKAAMMSIGYAGSQHVRITMRVYMGFNPKK